MADASADLSNRRRARLLIVTRDRFPPFRVDLTELFGRWLSRRYDLDWVMRREAAAPPVTVDAQFSQLFLVSNPGPWSWVILQVRQSIRVARGRADLVQVRDAAVSAAIFLAAARIGRKPFTYWMSYPMAEGYLHRGRHQTPPDKPLLRWSRLIYGALAMHLLYRWVLPRADHVFVQSERMRADVVAKGVAAERISAVPMGISVAVYDHCTITPTNDPRLSGRRMLLYLGALDPEREIERLAQALLRVVAAGFDAVLVIVGEAHGLDRWRIEQAATDAGVSDRLVFTGRLPLVEALSYVRRAEVCLAPFPIWPATYLSATPTKLVEYLAMGRPVVATDHPDQRQVIDDSGAGIIAPFTAEGLAAAIIDLLGDPAQAEAMGARGPAWVAAHRDYAVISRAVAEVYDRLLNETVG